MQSRRDPKEKLAANYLAFVRLCINRNLAVCSEPVP